MHGSNFQYYHDKEWHTVRSKTDACKVGQMLWDENIRSVSGRYPDCKTLDDLPGVIGENYQLTESDIRPVMAVKAADVFSACKCYEYQACEHDGWKNSEAKAVIESLKNQAVRLIPGMEEASWGAPEWYRNVA